VAVTQIHLKLNQNLKLMGYRTYIGYMPKKTYNKIKRFTPDELYSHYNKTDEKYIGVYEYGTELYEFGKDTEFNSPKKSHKNFFTKKETQAKYEGYEFQIVTKEFLAYIIDSYNKRIQDYYNDMVSPFFGKELLTNPSEFMNTIKRSGYFDKPNVTFDFTKITQEESNALYKILEHVRTFSPEWTYLTPYNLDSGEAITTSWKYEYSIFELVRIYKSFDWKKNQMYYYGY